MHTIGRTGVTLPRVAWVALGLIWGSTWLGVGIGLQTLPPLTFAGLRFLIASVALLIAVALRGTPLPRTAGVWSLIVATGVFGFSLSYAAQFWGMQFVPSGLAAVIFSTVPLFTLVFAHAFLPSEPLTLRKLAGVVLGIGGVGVIFADQLVADNSTAILGVVAFLVGSAALAGTQVAVKARVAALDPLVLAGSQMGVTGIVLFSLGAVIEGNPLRLEWTPAAVGSVAYLALVGSAFAFSLFYWLLKHMPVTNTLSVMLTHPPVAIVLGWLVLGETLGIRVLVGASVIGAGLWLILRAGRQRSRRWQAVPGVIGSWVRSRLAPAVTR